MKTTTVKTYDFEELGEEAKSKACEWYRSINEYDFLKDSLENDLALRLEEQGLSYSEIRVFYSLSYCQGDGVMFEADGLEWEGYTVNVKHGGRYYHENSGEYTFYDKDGEEYWTEGLKAKFHAWYAPLCESLARFGYDEIEYENRDEVIGEYLQDSSHQFLEDGTLAPVTYNNL